MKNDNKFLKFLTDLQRKIEYEEEKYYSKVVINEYRNPSNFGFLENPDALSDFKGPCGDTLKISLRIKNGMIEDARFWTDGCGATIACGSMLTKMIIGLNLDEASLITDVSLISSLNGLPDEHLHCSQLAINSLKIAIDNYEHEKKVKKNIRR
jgi:nitrogen fixation NifU-like protein